jgi:hypothetical protein
MNLFRHHINVWTVALFFLIVGLALMSSCSQNLNSNSSSGGKGTAAEAQTFVTEA